MLLWVWCRNDATGLLDAEFKDGDVLLTRPDSFEPSIGTQEVKSFLIIKIPNPPNMVAIEEDLVRSEYSPGATPDDEHVIRRKRIYRLDWRTKFTESEIDIISDSNAVLPDGNTVLGGVVSSGVVSDLFTISDFRRK